MAVTKHIMLLCLFLLSFFYCFLHAVRLISFSLKMESMIIHKIIFRLVAPHQFGAHFGCRVHKIRRCAPSKTTFSPIVRISSSTFSYRWSRLRTEKKSLYSKENIFNAMLVSEGGRSLINQRRAQHAGSTGPAPSTSTDKCQRKSDLREA